MGFGGDLEDGAGEIAGENRILRRRQEELVSFAADLAKIVEDQRERKDELEAEIKSLRSNLEVAGKRSSELEAAVSRLRETLDVATRIVRPFAAAAVSLGKAVRTSPGDVSLFLHQTTTHIPKGALALAEDYIALVDAGRLGG